MRKKLRNIIFWVIVLIYFIVTLSFVNDQKSFIRCKDIDVKIVDGTENNFIDHRDIIKILRDNKLNVLGYLHDSINLETIEQKIIEHPSVKEANVFTTLDGILHINIKQRKPLFRVLSGNMAYYVDHEGYLMPLSNKYTAKVLLVTGKINEPYSKWYGKNIIETGEQMGEGNQKSLLFDLFELVSYLNSDPFWKSQIHQIFIDDSGDLILIPKIGEHKIILGDINNYKDKMKRLYLFYKHGLRVEGWNKYSVINLKYENQIVCTIKNQQHG
ncbi:MAG: cell division protein FtsQ [Marinilabiliales bacterium]